MKTQTMLLLLLFFCHFLADYTHLSTNWMLNAKRLGKPIWPILTHAMVHAILMGTVLFFFTPISEPEFWNLFFFQLWSHFLIDVLKGKMNVWFPSLQSPANKWHWIVFGADQFLHATVIVLMVNYLNL